MLGGIVLHDLALKERAGFRVVVGDIKQCQNSGNENMVDLLEGKVGDVILQKGQIYGCSGRGVDPGLGFCR